MLKFKCTDFLPLQEALFTISRINEKGYFKSFTKLFIFATNYQDFPFTLVTLKIMPQFFSQYNCHSYYYFNLRIHHLYRLLRTARSIGFSSIVFNLQDGKTRKEIVLTYSSDERKSSRTIIPTLDPVERQNIPPIKYDAFLSMETDEFKSLIVHLNDHTATVTVGCSSVRFSSTHKMIGFTKQSSKCIIGGINRVEEEINFTITFQPIEFFNSLTTKRVWFFKPLSLSNCIAMVSPIHLHAEISSFFV